MIGHSLGVGLVSRQILVIELTLFFSSRVQSRALQPYLSGTVFLPLRYDCSHSVKTSLCPCGAILLNMTTRPAADRR